MSVDVGRVNDIRDLRNFVNQTICNNNQLEIGAFELTEKVLRRRAGLCGMYFCLHGPRSVKFTAIWETDRNSVLFYGSGGERVGTYRLPQRVRMVEPALID
jgi:hypothetical protein